jgi:hypothetical protein
MIALIISFNSFSWGEVGWDWIHLVRQPLVDLSCQSRTVAQYGTDGRMRIGRGNRSTRRKPAQVLLRPPQIPHDLTWDRVLAAAVGSRRLSYGTALGSNVTRILMNLVLAARITRLVA